MAYLFGDLISVSELEILWIFAGGSILMVLLFWLWQPLLAATIHEELARVEGLPVERLRLALILMMALVIAVAMKIVGVLLISSLMIIPAATARRFSRTPEQMAILAVVLGLLSVTGGIYTAYLIDTPAGPSVVVCSAAIFLISQLLPAKSV
jgi:zinc transport system permease protein